MSIAPWAEIVPDAPYPMTQEEYEHWPDDGGIYELIAGRLVRQVGNTGLHDDVSLDVFRVLDAYAQSRGGWRAYPAWTCRLHIPGESKDRDLRPDCCLIRSEHLPAKNERYNRTTGWNRIMDIAPDLVVEIASEGQDLGEKSQQYLAAGVRLVWNIYPLDRMADIWQAGDTKPTLLGYADWLDGRDVAPGLSIALRAILVG